MSRFTLGALICLSVMWSASAEDWTGKKIKAKDDVKPGKRDGSGLVRGSDVVKKGTELTVKADDGTFLELDGKFGTIFKTEAVLASNDPNALPSDGTTWTVGAPVFEREPHSLIPIERRYKDGLVTVQGRWIPQATPTVLKDGDDGTVLLTDGATEVRVKKKNLMTLDDVAVWAERRLKANSKDWYVLWVRAGVFMHEEQYGEAEKDLTAVIKIYRDVPAFHNTRGWVREQLDDADGAIEDFNEVLRLDPKFSDAIAHRGYCCMLKGRYAKADADLTVWLQGHPDDVSWLAYRAEVRFQMGEWDKCLADAESLLKADPKRYDMIPYKALSLGKLKKYQDAVDCFNKGIEDYNMVSSYVAYARFLSTCPDEKFRDAVLAITLMRRAQQSAELAKQEMPAKYLEVFAAVYAEGAEYELAIEKQTDAIERLKADKKTPATELKRAEKVLELYEKKKPLRDE